MTITPITPVDREKLVPTSTSILIDFTGTPTLVDVNGTVVFDGSFQAGWSGSLLNHVNGKRLVLDPPSVFSLGALVTVDVTEDGVNRLLYLFETGTTQITVTDDTSAPRIVKTGAVISSTPVPTFHLKMNDISGPISDEEGNYPFSVQGGGAVFQEPGVIDDAVSLNGSTYLQAQTVGTTVSEYIQELTLTNAGSTLTDFQIRVVIDSAALILAGKMFPDATARFTDALDVPLDHWLEGPADDAATTYWVKLPSLPSGNTVIKVRYNGSTSFSSFEDGDAVFEFFDDFPGISSSVDAGKWTEVDTGSNISVNNQLNFTGGTNSWTTTGIHSNQSWSRASQQYVIEARMTRNNNLFAMIGWKDLDAGVNYTNMPYAFYDASNIGVIQAYEDGNFRFSLTDPFTTGVPEIIQVETKVAGAEYRYSLDDRSSFQSLYSSVYSSENPLRVQITSYLAGSSFDVDWIIVRKAGAQPSIAFGAETSEQVPVPPDPDCLKRQVFSLAGWIKAGVVGSSQVIASSGHGVDQGWVLRELANQRLELTVYGPTAASITVTTTSIVSTGAFIHIGVSVDAPNSIAEITVNGVAESSTGSWGFTFIQYDSGPDFEFGRDPSDDDEYLTAVLDEWYLFSDLFLSELQFRGLFQIGVPQAPIPYVSYVRSPGQLQLRIADPIGAEVPLVDGTIVDIGYDPTLDKLIVFFVNNGKVFVTAANPGDIPSSLVQPSVLDNDLSVGSPAGGGVGINRDLSLVSFPPAKVPVLEDVDIGSPASGGLGGFLSAFPRAITPVVVSAPPNDVVVRFPRPTDQPESLLIIGVIPIKFVPGSGYHSLGFIPFPAPATGINFVDFQDPVITASSRYKAIAVYRRGDSPGTIRSPIGDSAGLPTAADLLLSPAVGGGVGIIRDLNLASFPPIKLATAPDVLDVGSPAGGGLGVGFSATGFPPIGVG